jgi:KDO transferase-3
MNGSILKCEADGVKPLFYICDDVRFIEERPMLAIKGLDLAQQLAMSVDCYERLHQLESQRLTQARLYCLQRVNRRHRRPIMSDRHFAWSIRKDPYLHSGFSLLHVKPNRIGFSTHLGRGYFGSRTIPIGALQLACHLGFQRAFLIGVDLNPSAGRFYERGVTAMPSTLDSDFQDYILPSFRLMRERVVRPGHFEVFNLSSESRLPADVVPRLAAENLDDWL